MTHKESPFTYTGPFSLREIEARLLEIDAEKSARIHNARENPSFDLEAIMEADEIKYLDVEKRQLHLKRQFILDNRNNWRTKTVWNIAVPIVISIITAYIISLLAR